MSTPPQTEIPALLTINFATKHNAKSEQTRWRFKETSGAAKTTPTGYLYKYISSLFMVSTPKTRYELLPSPHLEHQLLHVSFHAELQGVNIFHIFILLVQEKPLYWLTSSRANCLG